MRLGAHDVNDALPPRHDPVTSTGVQEALENQYSRAFFSSVPLPRFLSSQVSIPRIWWAGFPLPHRESRSASLRGAL